MLPAGPFDRVMVVGVSGSGKSTLGARLAAIMGCPHFELDALNHLAGWTENPALAADVDVACPADGRWVSDGGYHEVAGRVLLPRADVVVWLDLPAHVTFRAVVGRTASRIARRTELWNGNRERWWTVLDADHPIRWTLSSRARVRARWLDHAGPPPVVQLRSRREVAALLDSWPP